MSGVLRWSRSNPCPICGGCQEDAPGHGVRCHGYLSSDEKVARCAREEHAGPMPPDENGLFPHWLDGKCQCGETHGEAEADWFTGEKPKPAAKNKKTASSSTPKKIAATYDYLDAAGDPLFQVVRFEPKDFRQRRSDGHGGWIWCLGELEPVLYHLPDVLEWVGLGKTIFLAEGEKDVDALIAAGAAATCNAMGAGAGKWRESYTQTLAGATVRIVQDADEPGRAHAAKVKASLEAAGCSVTLWEAASGKDAADHLTAGYGVDDFVQAGVDLSARESRILALRHALSNGATSVSRFLDHEPPPQDWIFEGMIERGAVGLIVAAGSTGKGFFELFLGMKAAIGHPLCGFRPPRPQRVLILSLEDTEPKLHRRLRNTVESEYPKGLSQQESINLRTNLEILSLAGEGLDISALADVLIGSKERDLILIDPLTLCLPAQKDSINSQEGAGFVHRELWRIVEHAPGRPTVVPAHHVPKHIQLGDQQLNQAAASGSHILVDLARFSINLRKMDNKEVAKLRLDPRDKYIEMQIPKVNDAPELHQAVTFKRGTGGALVPVELPSQVSSDADEILLALHRMTLPIRQKELERHFASIDLDENERIPQKRFLRAIQWLSDHGMAVVVPLQEKGNPKEIDLPA